MTPEANVVELTPEGTHALRRAVLRNGDPQASVVFTEDGWAGVVHLGVEVDGQVVGVSSWVPRAHDGEDAVQLRGMATDASMQGTGIGGILLEAGCARLAAAGVPLVWARARDAALAFYLRHEFAVEGDGFIDETTQLPHHLVIRRLRPT